MRTLELYVFIFAFMLFILAEVAQTQSQIKIGSKLEDYNSCLTENNVSDNDIYTIAEVLEEKHKKSENQERTRKNGCVFHCLLEKTGMMNGLEFNVNNMHNELTRRTNAHPGDLIYTAVDNCINEAKDISGQCEKGAAFVTCVMLA